eukprot:scaffold131148_cov15-Tisochrysis_lutea.AAC.1
MYGVLLHGEVGKAALDLQSNHGCVAIDGECNEEQYPGKLQAWIGERECNRNVRCSKLECYMVPDSQVIASEELAGKEFMHIRLCS